MAKNAIASVESSAGGGGGMTIWGTDNPQEVMNRAAKVAKVLSDVIESRKMYTMIGSGKHIRVEGWQTLGAMTGVFSVVAWTRKIENGWEARVEARTKFGELVGAAESECLNTESNWSEGKKKEDHHLRSMAQTRATSKALASALRFIVALAGYEGTPAEEMPSEPRPSDAFNRPREKKTGTAATGGTAAAPASGHKDWTGKIQGVTFREYAKKGPDGKPTGEKGKTYTITGKDGKVFKTWSDTFATDCKFASENDEEMVIKYSESEFRGSIEAKAEEVYPANTEPGVDVNLAVGDESEEA